MPIRIASILRRATWGAAMLALSVAPALAEGAKSGPSESVFIIQIGVLLVAGRLLGELMLRIGQPAVMGQLIAGLKAAGNPIDRKSLADLATSSPAAFARLAKMAAEAKPAPATRARA